MNERLEKIKRIIVERDKNLDDDGDVKDYSLYDQQVYELNDHGHIDWMIEKIEKQQRELDHLNNMPIIREIIRLQERLAITEEALEIILKLTDSATLFLAKEHAKNALRGR